MDRKEKIIFVLLSHGWFPWDEDDLGMDGYPLFWWDGFDASRLWACRGAFREFMRRRRIEKWSANW